jgi:rhodanese-related sulfurtransferase
MSRSVPEVTVDAVGGDAYLLDVRDHDEWAAGHAPEAHHVPMMELLGRLDELPGDRDLVVVCRVGSRSAQVVAYLQAHGWDRASNLAGGMHAWQAAGRRMVSDDGSAAYVL